MRISISKMSRRQRVAIVLGCGTVIVCGVFLSYVGIRRMMEGKRPLTHAELMGTAELKADARDLKRTIVVPHLEQAIDGDRNVLWCATFQMVWDEIAEDQGSEVGGSGQSDMVASLNRRLVTADDLDPDSYIVCSARSGGSQFVSEIKRMLDEKFNGRASPQLLNRIPLEVGAGNWVTYCYLFKHLPFKHHFDRLDRPLLFGNKKIKCFGIDSISDSREEELAKQVFIPYYEGPDDFVIELWTDSTEDRLILAKMQPAATLVETIRIVQERSELESKHRLRVSSTLQVPILSFDVGRSYHELSKATGLLGIQQIRFRLDEAGAVLLSEAYVGGGGLKPENLIFDKPFLIMIQRVGAGMPYFALWVANAELLVAFE